jgi:glycine oxidase
VTRTLPPVDVVVSGGGIVAAAIALELARRDLSVQLVARGRAGRPSGPGGPVAAQADAGGPEALADLALLSRHLFSDWVSALEEETGLPCEYDERGAMRVAFDEEGEMALDRALDAQRQRGLHFEVLDAEEARGREPALTPDLHAAFAFPRDGVARAGRVAKALVLAARAAGVRVREGAAAEAVAVAGGRVSGLRTSAGLVPAEAVVLAGRGGPDGVAGAPRLRLGLAARPWLRLDASADPDRPTRLLRSPDAGLVPRRDGTLLALAGAPADEAAGRPSARSAGRLLAALERLVPGSREWAVVRAGAAGERTAADGLPVLGDAGEEGLVLAAGWGGGELLLAPAAAAVVADLVTGRVPALGVAAFSPSRMGA